MKPRTGKSSANHPLGGMRVLVGRARHQAGALSSALRSLGADVIEIPFIEIRKPRSYRPLDSALKVLATYDWLILTSVNGVEAMWNRMKTLRISRRELAHLHVAAIGPATEKAIQKQRLKVEVVPKEYVAESVVRSLKKRVKGKRVLLVRAKVARDVIPRELRKLAAKVDVVEAYETVMPESSRARLRALLEDKNRRPHVITFTSSSTACNFVNLIEGRRRVGTPASILNGVQTASIGPVTSATLRELGLPVNLQARAFTIPGLVEAIVASHRADFRESSQPH